MVQTNFEEMQKLGEKLQALVTEARPLLKDLQISVRTIHELEESVNRKLSITRERAEEAAKAYKAVIELENIIDRKLKNIIDQTAMCTDEIDQLTELHMNVQQDISKMLQEYIAKRPAHDTGTAAKTYANIEQIPAADIKNRYGV